MDAGETLVVDASVAAMWHLADEEYVDQALLLLAQVIAGRTQAVAPEYIRYEVPSAITQAARGRSPRLTPAQAVAAVAEYLRWPIKPYDGSELVLAACPLVAELGCAFYDALYVALARRLSLPFITADRRLYERIRHLPHMIWIGAYVPRVDQNSGEEP